MKYLVTGEAIEPAPPMKPEFFEQLIIPSLDALIRLEGDKKVLGGGIATGVRVGVAIIEAESNEELSKLLMSLPFWGILKWDVTLLDSFETRNTEHRELAKKLKGSQQ